MSAPSELPQPRTAAGRAGLDALLREPARALVGFDFDGTLAPIVPDPDAARAHPRALPALVRLAEHVGRIAVVTGRPAAVAVDRAGLAGVPGLEGLVVLGHYGLERWEAVTGEVVSPPVSPAVEAVRRALPDVVDGTDAWVEDKGSALAVHTRRAADPDGLLARLHGPLVALAEEQGLAVEPGRMVVELRPPGIDKGGALAGLVAQDRPSAVVFMGDDLGDLAAFAAVESLRAEGLPGLLVCSGSTEVTALAERADLVVDGPDGVVDLLDALVAAMSGPR